MKVAVRHDRTHNPSDEAHRVSRLRENFTSGSYGEGLETGRRRTLTGHEGGNPGHRQERSYYALPRQSFTRQTSYRLANQLLGWTTSANPAYRFVLMALGFVLLNLWVVLCWEFTQVARRGGRFLDTERFRQQRFIHFLIHALETLYGRILAITAPTVPLF